MIRLRDRRGIGGEIVVNSDEQAAFWEARKYERVDSPPKSEEKPAPRRRAARKKSS